MVSPGVVGYCVVLMDLRRDKSRFDQEGQMTAPAAQRAWINKNLGKPLDCDNDA